MCCCCLFSFLNSTFLSTLVSAILSGLLIYATVSIAHRQSKQQKEIHEQRLLADREDRIINIYSIFAACGRLFLLVTPSAKIELELFSNDSRILKILEHQTKLCKALDEAKLIFDEGSPIIKRLESICEKYMRLSNKELELNAEYKAKMPKVIETLQKEFPNYSINSVKDVLNYTDVLHRFDELIPNHQQDEMKNEIRFFRDVDLSDEGLDNYFKPYVNRIPVPNRKNKR